MTPAERDAVLEEAAGECLRLSTKWREISRSPALDTEEVLSIIDNTEGAERCAEAIRALKKADARGGSAMETPASQGAPASSAPSPAQGDK